MVKWAVDAVGMLPRFEMLERGLFVILLPFLSYCCALRFVAVLYGCFARSCVCPWLVPWVGDAGLSGGDGETRRSKDVN